jgi:hypothetical protein
VVTVSVVEHNTVYSWPMRLPQLLAELEDRIDIGRLRVNSPK